MDKKLATNSNKNKILNYFTKKYELDKAMELTSKFLVKDFSNIEGTEIQEIYAMLNLKGQKQEFKKIIIDNANHVIC